MSNKMPNYVTVYIQDKYLDKLKILSENKLKSKFINWCLENKCFDKFMSKHKKNNES